jgi:hypothetical protein
MRAGPVHVARDGPKLGQMISNVLVLAPSLITQMGENGKPVGLGTSFGALF